MTSRTDREHRRWVKEIVEKPLRKDWGDAWHRVFTEEIRSALIDAQCMSIVASWDNPTAEQIQRLRQTAHELFETGRFVKEDSHA